MGGDKVPEVLESGGKSLRGHGKEKTNDERYNERHLPRTMLDPKTPVAESERDGSLPERERSTRSHYNGREKKSY